MVRRDMDTCCSLYYSAEWLAALADKKSHLNKMLTNDQVSSSHGVLPGDGPSSRLWLGSNICGIVLAGALICAVREGPGSGTRRLWRRRGSCGTAGTGWRWTASTISRSRVLCWSLCWACAGEACAAAEPSPAHPSRFRRSACRRGPCDPERLRARVPRWLRGARQRQALHHWRCQAELAGRLVTSSSGFELAVRVL